MSRRARLAVVLGCFAVCGAGAIVHRAVEARRAVVQPGELYEIIWRQITAFREADYARAYRQVSSTYQERWKVDAFAELARAEHPGLFRAEHVEFGAVRAEGRRAVVLVFFFLPDGDVIPCLYSLLHEEGAWKIDGARVQPRWPAEQRAPDLRT